MAFLQHITKCKNWRSLIGHGRMMSSYQFNTLQVEQTGDNVYHVQLNRPDKRNSIDDDMWKEIPQCFDSLGTDSSCRVIILSGAGKMFCSGIDLSVLAMLQDPNQEVARRAIAMRIGVKKFQDAFTSIEKQLCNGVPTTYNKMQKLAFTDRSLVFQILSYPGHGRMMSSYQFNTLQVEQTGDNVYHVQLNRPDKRNSIDADMWKEIPQCFDSLGTDSSCRVIILSGAGKMFCSGIDLSVLAMLHDPNQEVARRAIAMRIAVKKFQDTFTSIEKCPKPVIASIHGGCIGAGIDMTSACDIRLCSQDAFFSIKEVDMGLAADVGTLQRFPKIVGNDSLVRELVYTARNFSATEAKDIGFVSSVHADAKTLTDASIKLATNIASKSPVAITGSKINMNYSRDHSVDEGLNYIANWNMSMLQSEDLMTSVQAAMTKTPPKYKDL
ncbi:Delta(3,5)-Delta(2,4)-dienoyl-CoA isomerase, mitochondrial [Trichoplax sp. H2]|nr:Delta(3,5)-Delta(2,4)-dienoyl-CoA isomerase, mitochondrial [Trichoplax sp. H2]|eukprot:RDD39819.1 Delta(3,5)-Delta(2,4)-dienoyl-CoA isomerase, mitochondrial [Trichoplax sp. H2]